MDMLKAVNRRRCLQQLLAVSAVSLCSGVLAACGGAVTSSVSGGTTATGTISLSSTTALRSTAAPTAFRRVDDGQRQRATCRHEQRQGCGPVGHLHELVHSAATWRSGSEAPAGPACQGRTEYTGEQSGQPRVAMPTTRSC